MRAPANIAAMMATPAERLTLRREERRACPDDDPRGAVRDTIALVAALGVGERGVHQRDRVAEALAEPSHGLRRQCDLRDEDDGAEPAFEGRRARMQVDLGLPAPRRPGEEEVVAEPFVEGGHDAVDRSPLLERQRRRRRLAAESLSRGRRRALRAPLTPSRRDELERASGRRAVVVGQPQREIDERAWDLVEQRADRSEGDTRRRRDADLGDHATRAGASQADGDHGPFSHPVGHLVGERARERAGAHERIDGGERHASSLDPQPEALRRRDAAGGVSRT